MKKLVINKKTGYVSNTPFTIYDSRGITFYSSDFVKGNVSYFNLPKGTYYLTGEIKKTKKPKEYILQRLPRRERNLRKGKYSINFSPNKNKCTINHRLKTIIFDTAFKKAPKYILCDIYAHELGHLLYTTENYADRYATNFLLKRGFNPSQIGRSLHVSLSSKNIDRKRDTNNFLKRTIKKSGHG